MHQEIMKGTAIVVVFLCGFLGVMVPRLFDPFGRSLNYVNLFAAGILLFVALVHLLGSVPDALATAPLPRSHDGTPYPWSFVFCALAFVLLFLGERLFIAFYFREHCCDVTDAVAEKKIYAGVKIHRESISEDHCDHTNHHNHTSPPSSHHHHHSKTTKSSKQKYQALRRDDDDIHSCSHGSPQLTMTAPTNITDTIGSLKHMTHSHENTNVLQQRSIVGHGAEIADLFHHGQLLNATILLLGLGVHSLLAGLALGTTQDVSMIASLMVAVVTHKFLAAFALGCPLHKANITLCKALGVACGFGSITPVGIAIGWGLGENVPDWVGAIFISIASGTFLYVAIIETLLPEFGEGEEHNPFMDFVMSTQELSRIPNQGHNHSHDHHDHDHDHDHNKHEVKVHEKSGLVLERMQVMKPNIQKELIQTCCVLAGFGVMSLVAGWV